MIASITQWILESLRAHGALSVFIGVLIEQIIVPIPSPLIIMGAGAVLIDSQAGLLQAFFDIGRVIVLPGSLASTLGAFIGYGVGYWGGRPVIERFSKFLGFGWLEVEAMDRRLKKGNVALAIFMLRALPVVPLSLISGAVGVIRWPVAPFALWTFLGSVPRCFVLGYLGWLLRDAYEAFARRLDFLETLLSVGLVGSVFVLVLWIRHRLKKQGLGR